MTCTYEINSYAEARIARSESGGAGLIIVKGGGNRVEWIRIPSGDVDEVVRPIQEHAGDRGTS